MHKFIKITSLGSSGEGVGSIDGMKVFIEGALPEEEVEVELTQIKRKYAIGSLKQILVPSPDRRHPPCPLFGTCGGCQIMHLNDDAQLVAKYQKVVDALERIGGFKGISVNPCIPSPQTLHYRNKIQLPVIWDKEKKIIGLYRKNSHEIIPLDRCLIQGSLGEEIFLLLKDLISVPSIRYLLIRTTHVTQEALVIFVTDGKHSKDLADLADTLINSHPSIKGVVENINPHDDNVILSSHFRLLAGQAYIQDRVGSKQFRFSASSFFQVNPLQAEALYRTAIEWANIHSSHVVMDAFCGVGALTLFAADFAKMSIGIECVPHAIEDARENARANLISNCTFYCGKAEVVMTSLPCPDIVFLNPPRKGCEPELLHFLGSNRPSALLYISCDPATLARDLKILTSHGFNIDQVQPFDMFPQTMHVETLVKLTK